MKKKILRVGAVVLVYAVSATSIAVFAKSKNNLSTTEPSTIYLSNEVGVSTYSSSIRDKIIDMIKNNKIQIEDKSYDGTPYAFINGKIIEEIYIDGVKVKLRAYFIVEGDKNNYDFYYKNDGKDYYYKKNSNVEYENGNVKAQKIRLEYTVDSQTDFITLSTNAKKINPIDKLNLNNYKFLSKSYDGTPTVFVNYGIQEPADIGAYFVVKNKDESKNDDCYYIDNNYYIKNSDVVYSKKTGNVMNQDIIWVIDKNNLSDDFSVENASVLKIDNDNATILLKVTDIKDEEERVTINPIEYSVKIKNGSEYFKEGEKIEIYEGQGLEYDLFYDGKKVEDEIRKNININFTSNEKGKLSIESFEVKGSNSDNYKFNIPDVEFKISEFVTDKVPYAKPEYKIGLIQDEVDKIKYYYNRVTLNAPEGFKLEFDMYNTIFDSDYNFKENYLIVEIQYSDGTRHYCQIKDGEEIKYKLISTKEDEFGATAYQSFTYSDIITSAASNFDVTDEKAVLILNITNPVATHSLEGEKKVGEETYFNSEGGKITVKAKDPSGIDEIQLVLEKAGEGTIVTGFKESQKNEIIIDINQLKSSGNEYLIPDGEYILKCSVRNAIGCSYSVELCTFKIDRKIDEVNIKTIPGAVENNDKIWCGFNQKDKELEINFSDVGSGIKTVILYDNGTEIARATSEDIEKGSLKYNVSNFAEGEHSITVYVEDNVGNKTITKDEEAYKFNVDKTVHDADINSIPNAFEAEDGTIWCGLNQKDEKLVINFSDDGSGIKTVILYDNGTEIAKATSEDIANNALQYNVSNFAEGEHIIAVYVEDNVGNKTKKENAYKFNVDKTVHDADIKSIPGAVENNGKIWCGPDQKDEKLVINFSDDGSGIKTVILYDNGTEIARATSEDTKIEYNVSNFAEGEHIIAVYVEDNVGNKTKKENAYKFNVDKTVNDANINPIPNAFKAEDDTIWCGLNQKDEKLVINFSDDGSGIKTVILYDNGTEIARATSKDTAIEYNVSDFAEGEHIIAVSVEDNVGNETKKENAYTFNVDKKINAPVITMPEASYEGIWYGNDKEKNVNIKFTDNESGIKSIIVKDNDKTIYDSSKDLSSEIGEFKKVSDYKWNFTYDLSKISGDGKHTIVATITDNVGNNKSTEQVYYIDRGNPNIEKITFIPVGGEEFEGSFVEKLEYGFYFNKPAKAKIYIKDSVINGSVTSGLDKVKYKLVSYNNGYKVDEENGLTNIKEEIDENGSINYVAYIDINANFKGQIYVNAYDNVKNASGEVIPQAIVIDTEEKHLSETHIYITSSQSTNYKDAEGNPLYTSDVTMTATVQDTVSGIKELSYEISAENGSVSKQTITINNTGYSVGQSLGDGWTVTKTDKNLVTEVQKVYKFSNDDNNIQLKIEAKDRSGNKSELSSNKITIDKTAPIINVEFDSPKGNGKYYTDNRSATITVTERNFDANRIISNITNTIGSVPEISFQEISKNQYSANITFGEGNYKFNISGTDRGNQSAVVNYIGNNANDFVVDLTNPIESDNFNSFINALNNTFSETKIMTISFDEHNFDPSLVNIVVYKAPSGQVLTSSNRVVVPTNLSWNNNGDKHTTTISFADDAVYQVAVSMNDLSGRTIDNKISKTFEIDKTTPKLSESSVKDSGITVYSDDKDKSSKPIVFYDANIKKIDYKINIYQVLKDDNLGYDIFTDTVSDTIEGNALTLPENYFNQDGIYEVKAKAYDVVGNVSEEVVHTYAILRNSKFLVYIPNSDADKGTGLYSFNRIGKKASDIEDINIKMYILKNSSYKIRVQDNELDSGYYTINSEISDEINQVKIVDLTIDKSYFSTNYGSADCNELLSLDVIVDSEPINVGYVSIDNVKPSGNFDAYIQNLKWYSGYYNVSEQEIVIQGISRDIDISKCEILDGDKKIEFKYDEDARTISFILNKGKHSLSVKLVDTAGNDNILDTVNVYVGSFVGRWWIPIAIGVFVIITATAVIIIRIRKKD